MKRTLCFLLAVIMCVSVCSCGGIDYETAAWEGYDRVSFAEFLEDGLGGYGYESIGVDVNWAIDFVEGWDDSELLNENMDLTKGNKAITFTARYSTDTEGVAVWKFFMEYDSKEKLLKVKGMYNTIEEYGKNATEMVLEAFCDYQ